MNAVFDIGNVLLDSVDKETLGESISEDTKAKELILNVFSTEEWKKLDAGEITKDEAKKIIKKEVGIKDEKYVDYVFENWYKNLIRNEHMVRVAQYLKKIGWNVFILSNAQSEIRHFLDEIFGEEFFDGIVISQEEKQMKPDREIYETLINRYKIKPADSIFIDDLHKNVETASELGFSIIEYTGDNQKVIDIIKEKIQEERYASHTVPDEDVR